MINVRGAIDKIAKDISNNDLEYLIVRDLLIHSAILVGGERYHLRDGEEREIYDYLDEVIVKVLDEINYEGEHRDSGYTSILLHTLGFRMVFPNSVFNTPPNNAQYLRALNIWSDKAKVYNLMEEYLLRSYNYIINC